MLPGLQEQYAQAAANIAARAGRANRFTHVIDCTDVPQSQKGGAERQAQRIPSLLTHGKQYPHRKIVATELVDQIRLMGLYKLASFYTTCYKFFEAF